MNCRRIIIPCCVCSVSFPSDVIRQEPNDDGQVAEWELQLMRGVAAAVSLFVNATGTLSCLDAGGSPNEDTGADLSGWGYQVLAEIRAMISIHE